MYDVYVSSLPKVVDNDVVPDNDVRLFLFLDKFPDILSENGIISMGYSIFIQETDTRYVGSLMMVCIIGK